VGGGLAAVAVGASLTACPGTVTPAGFVPIQGVTLNLGDVLGSLRCGTGPGQVYKYTVVVWDAVDGGPRDLAHPLASNVWDCFSQAVFDNLTSDAGSDTFFLRIYAYSYAGALAAQGSAGGEGSIDTGFWCQGGLGKDGATCSFVQDPGFAVSLGDSAQWAASCTATEPSGAPITALCGPLEPIGPSAPSSDAAAEASPDAASDAAGAPADSGEAGSPESSTDTGTSETSVTDASAPDSSSLDSGSEASAPDSSTEAGD
jgi:hypothetical protein